MQRLLCWPSLKAIESQRPQESSLQNDEQQKQEHVENGVRGDDIEHVHTEESSQTNPNAV